jgi:hypothetical protein
MTPEDVREMDERERGLALPLNDDVEGEAYQDAIDRQLVEATKLRLWLITNARPLIDAAISLPKVIEERDKLKAEVVELNRQLKNAVDMMVDTGHEFADLVNQKKNLQGELPSTN